MGADGLPDEGDGGVLNAVACHVAEALGVDAEAVGRDGHRAEARDDTDEQHLCRREGRTLSGQRCTHPPEVAQAGGGDAPAAGLSDAKRAVPQQQDAQRQQTAHDGGESRAQRCARHREACAPDRDALAEQHQLPGGVDEEEVEHHVQRADQHADEAGGQGVAGGPEHGAIHPHRHGEGEGRRPDGEVGAGIGLERDVRPQPPGQEAADADTESRSAEAQHQVEKHGLPQHAPGVLLAVGPEVLGDLDRKCGVQSHKDAVEQPGARADDADGGGGLCADVAHHGGVDVLHRRDHQLLQNGRNAQRQRDAGRVGQRDVLALPHPGRELLQRKCHVVSCFLC